jgi:hypothetical protein
VFGERKAGWQLTASGHLVAALRAIPSDGDHAALQRTIGDAIASLETVHAAP